jgi:hypothetical protein
MIGASVILADFNLILPLVFGLAKPERTLNPMLTFITN